MMMKLAMMGIMAMFAAGAGFGFDFTQDPKELMKSCMSNVKNECQKWAAAGGGSGNPKGLTTQVAVELAMGERYMVYGTVTVQRNQAYLEIDFEQHPWLKTQRRAQNPYYRIDTNDLETWKRLNRKYVSFVATAQGAIFVDDQGRRMFDIMLLPTSAPLVDAIRGHQR